jgi:simple sugar transport system permease protein
MPWRKPMPAWHNSLPVVVPIIATVVGLLVGLVLIMSTGASLGDTISTVWTGMLGSPFAAGTSLNRMAVLALVGGGFVISARCGLFNVGGEGQINVGGLAAAAVALKVVGGLPTPVALVLVIAAGATAGALWGAIAGVLRAYRGTNEVISTLLLNFIGIGLVSLAVHQENLLRQPVTSASTLPTSLPVPESTHLPLVLGQTSPANLGILLAGGVLIAAWIAMRHGMLGMRLRAVGLGPGAALRAGLDTGRTQILAMSLSGAPAGVAGALLVLAVPFVLQDGFSSGYGFDGLVVGLLARGSILGVFAGAALFGCLRSGGVAMQIGLSIPAETVLIVQALIVIAVAGTAVLTRANRSRSELI